MAEDEYGFGVDEYPELNEVTQAGPDAQSNQPKPKVAFKEVKGSREAW